MTDWTVHTGDCLEVMAGMEANTFDAIVTDPPYGLAFMGKAWDHAVPGPEFFAAMLRVAKPGAHIVAFGGTRLYHRMTCAMEDAGWEIRDCLMWLYGSGFPKSHDVSKAIDREAGAEREVVSEYSDNGRRCPKHQNTHATWNGDATVKITAPATPEAKRWQGWGTALKPAWEPIVLARKPLDGTVAQNHLRHGCGGVNVDGCRVATDELKGKVYNNNNTGWKCTSPPSTVYGNETGRWPANLILDAEAGAVLDGQAGVRTSGSVKAHHQRHTDGGNGKTHGRMAGVTGPCRDGNTGGASRFFYCPKASKADRDEGLEDSHAAMRNDGRATDIDNPYQRGKVMKNHHPTVKPTDLMRWLARLVTPTGGTILDPFTGSGSTGKAARLEGFGFVGIEREPEYADIARARIGAVEPSLIGGLA